MEISTRPAALLAGQSDALPAHLAKVFGRLGRALRYRTRAARQALGVTDSEYELLRLLGRQPGIHVHDAAVELGVASNSVSTLVKQLSHAGLVERTSDPLDGRAACLRLTGQAETWLKEVGSAREAAVARALSQLSDQERGDLQRALPSLTQLAEALTGLGGGAP